MGIAILSTSKGVISDKEARDFNIGGEVISSIAYKSGTSIQFEIKEAPGIYMVEVISQKGELAKFQVVKY